MAPAVGIGVIYKTLNENDQDPKYIEAKTLAEEMHSFNSAISLQDSLSSAIITVTLREYIQKKWDE